MTPDDLKRPMAVERFIIEAHGIEPMEAFYYAMKVAQGGRVSGPEHRKQHCYCSVFGNGVVVECFKRGKSERFRISKEK